MQVTRAEHAQKAATAALAAASTTSLARQDTLFKQHQEHTAELESLQVRPGLQAQGHFLCGLPTRVQWEAGRKLETQ